ncbi:MAG: hypothetical protein ACFFCP_05235 [Promethearchaeota archaeon]
MNSISFGENVHCTYLRIYNMKHMDAFQHRAGKSQSKQDWADLLGGDNMEKLRSYLNGRIKEICDNLMRPEITPYFETYLNVLLKMYTEFLEKLEGEYAPIEQPF